MPDNTGMRTHKRCTKNKGIEKIEKVARCQGSNPVLRDGVSTTIRYEIYKR